jgi:hypothetical protein
MDEVETPPRDPPGSDPPRRTVMTAQPSIPEPRKNLGDEMLTLDETAALLRVPENTLRYWRVTGAGPRSFKVGRHVRYWKADVILWLTEQMNRPQHH